MTDVIDADDDIEVDHLNTGRRAYFIQPWSAPDAVLNFSSTIENIGIHFDRSLRNHTEVMIISEEADAFHPTVGPMRVIKVLHMDAMWIPIVSLVIIKDIKDER